MTGPDRQRQRPGGAGTAVDIWHHHSKDLIKNASDAQDAIQLMTSARNSFESVGEELDALVLARAGANLNAEAERIMTQRIGELAKLAHHTEGR